MVVLEFWTTLKHPTYPTTDATRPIRRRNSNGHVRTSIWFSSYHHWTGRFDICIRQPGSFDKVFVVIRRCMSSWISVAAMKPQVVRTIGNTHVVLFLRLLGYCIDIWTNAWSWRSSWYSKQWTCGIAQLCGFCQRWGELNIDKNRTTSFLNSSIRVSMMY